LMGNASYRGARTLPVLLVIGAVAEFLVLGVPGRAKRRKRGATVI
jgi:hypothetical protein